MKGLFAKIGALALGAAMAVGVGVGVVMSQDESALQAKADSISYSLVFKDSGSASDGTTAFTTSTPVANIIDTDASKVSAIASTAKTYLGKSGYGLKFNSSSAVGNITFTLASEISVTKIVATAASYGTTDSPTLTINGSDTTTSDTLSTTLSPITFTYSTATSISSIAILGTKASKGRFYVTKLDLYVSGGTATTVTAISVAPTSSSANLDDTIATPTVTATVSGVTGQTYTNYSAAVGTLSGETFTSRTGMVFGTTKVALADNLIRITALDPTTDGGSTYVSCDMSITVSYATLTGLTISSSTVDMLQGESKTLSVTPVPANADGSVTWGSSDTNVATVDSSTGAVTVLSGATVGSTATITATSSVNSSITTTCVVTVITSVSYDLVTDLASLSNGDEVVIGGVNASSSYYAMGSTQNKNNRASVSATLSSNKLTPTSGYAVFTLGVETMSISSVDTTVYTFSDSSGYLYAASTSSNYLKSQATNDDNGRWLITLTDGVFSIVAQGTNTRNLMRFNYSNTPPIFSCYASSSTTGSAPLLYKAASTTPSISVTPTSLALSTTDSAQTLTATVENSGGATINWTKVDSSSIVTLSATTGESIAVTPQGTNVGSATITATITVSGTDYTADCAVTVSVPATETLVLTSNTTTYTTLDFSNFKTYINNSSSLTLSAITNIRVGAQSSGGSETDTIMIGTGDAAGTLTFYLPSGLWASKVVINAQTDAAATASTLSVNGVSQSVTSATPSDFTYYTFSNQVSISAVNRVFAPSITVYAVDETDLPSSFADYFLGEIVGNCDSTGVTNNVVVDDWNTAGLLYLDLPTSVDTAFKNAVANPSGTNIQHAVATYDYVVVKYTSAVYDDFMERSLSAAFGFSNNSNTLLNDSDNATLIIVLVSVVGLTAIGGFFFLNKKKKQESK